MFNIFVTLIGRSLLDMFWINGCNEEFWEFLWKSLWKKNSNIVVCLGNLRSFLEDFWKHLRATACHIIIRQSRFCSWLLLQIFPSYSHIFLVLNLYKRKFTLRGIRGNYLLILYYLEAAIQWCFKERPLWKLQKILKKCSWWSLLLVNVKEAMRL